MTPFDLVQLIIFIIPLGIFTTFGMLVAVAITMKVQKVDKVLKQIILCYCLLADLCSLLFLLHYYAPQLFARLDVLYSLAIIFTMIFFHRFLCYAIDPKKVFSLIHYIVLVFIGIMLFTCKTQFSVFWLSQGYAILFCVTIFFAIIYSILPFWEMYRFQFNFVKRTGKAVEIEKSKVIPYILHIILFPIVFIIIPFVTGTGPNPKIYLSILLILSLLLALMLNIPLIYTMIRHYTTPLNAASLLASGFTTDKVHMKGPSFFITDNIIDNESKKVASKNKIPAINGLEKEALENYLSKHKPYLNPKLTISVLVEDLNINRTYLSNYINKRYNMNFNAWVNSYRLKEMKWLLNSSQNKYKSAKDLYSKAGFASYRNYLRAVKQIELLNKDDE